MIKGFKQSVSRFRLSIDFTRTYFVMLAMFLVLANDYNKPVAGYLNISFELAWGALFVGMVVGSYLVSRVFVDVFGFYAHNADAQVELNPYSQGKINPQVAFIIGNIHLPVMRASGCSEKEIEVVEVALKKGDWRQET